MSNTYPLLSAFIFFVVFLINLFRLILNWSVVVNEWTVPYWISYPGVLGSAALCVWGFVQARRIKKQDRA